MSSARVKASKPSKTKAINFDGKFVEAIKEKKKRTTVRKGIKVFRRGEVVDLTSEGETFGKAKVAKVLVKRISELTEEDAKLDGFSSKEELIKELKRIYGEIKESDLVSIIHFDLEV